MKKKNNIDYQKIVNDLRHLMKVYVNDYDFATAIRR